MRQRTIAVFGSCVSRDAFALAPMAACKVGAYVARSSLAVTALAPVTGATVQAGLERIDSPFQRRMVTMDLDKRSLDELTMSLDSSAARRQPPAGFVLLDRIDERFDIVRIGESWATRSNEFLRMQLPDEVLGERLAMAAPHRQDLWQQGAQRVVEAIGPQRLILNKPYWARQLSDGSSLPNEQAIDAANAELGRMYRVFDDLGVRLTIDYPDTLLVADADHKWGISPFHYIPPFYVHTMQSLAAIVSGRNA